MAAMRALLIAQSPVLRLALRGILDGAFAPELIVEAESAIDAIPLVAAAEPNIVVIQEALTGVSGLLAGRILRELRPRVRLVVLSELIDQERVLLAVQHGAHALLPATVDAAGFIAAIEALAAGRDALRDFVLAEPELTDLVCATVRNDSSAPLWPESPNRRIALSLTGRDIGVLDGIVRGMSSRVIAERMQITEHVVRATSTSIFRKLGAVDRTTAVVAAIRAGIVELDVQLPIQPLPDLAQGTAVC